MRGYYYDISVPDADRVADALGSLRDKTPQVLRNAINKTASQTRKLMIKEAKGRYAVNDAGRRHLNDLKVRSRASIKNLQATLFISSFRNDLGYFQTSPKQPYTGKNVWNAPEHFTGKVLKASAMQSLTGTSEYSKGFLVRFASGHVGMVQRKLGEESVHKVTMRGKPRWKSGSGVVEKLRTMPSPSASAMHNVSWKQIQQDVATQASELLYENMDMEVQRIVQKYGKVR